MPNRRDWTPRRRIEELFRRELDRLLDRYLKFPNRADLGEINEALVDFGHFWEWFEDYGERAAARMVTGVAISNAKSWREAASISSQGAKIFRNLQRLPQNVEARRVELIRENAQLISTLPDRLREDSARYIAARQMRGDRPEAIARELARQLPHIAHTRLRLIARTETSRAATALTQARSEDLGLGWYIWSTSKDQRVRASHKLMDGVLVPWADPPAPEILAKEPSQGFYHAGNIYNCRCDPTPLVDYRQVHWPARVYRNRKIGRESLATFKRLQLAA